MLKTRTTSRGAHSSKTATPPHRHSVNDISLTRSRLWLTSARATCVIGGQQPVNLLSTEFFNHGLHACATLANDGADWVKPNLVTVHDDLCAVTRHTSN